MSQLARALDGDREALAAVLDDDAEAAALVRHATTTDALAPRFAEALLALRPLASWTTTFKAAADRWRDAEESRTGAWLDDEAVAAAAVAASRWALESICATRSADDPVALEAALALQEVDPRAPRDAILATLAAIERVAPAGALAAEAHLLLAERALPDEPAGCHARLDDAEAILRAMGSHAHERVARIRLGVLAWEGRYAEVVRRFGGLPGPPAPRVPAILSALGDRWRLPARAPASPLARAADELAEIVRWADAGTPEWVRALGTLAARAAAAGHPDAAVLDAAFAAGLARLAAGDAGGDAGAEAGGDEGDLAVVARQLRERGEDAAAARAQAVGRARGAEPR